VKAAVEALASGHPDVASVAFHYGFFCEPGKYCSAALPPLGHVIAMYGDGIGTVVNVRGHEDGSVTVDGVAPLPASPPGPDPTTFSDTD
jgi:hypothetical protein